MRTIILVLKKCTHMLWMHKRHIAFGLQFAIALFFNYQDVMERYVLYCKTLIFGGYLNLAILAVKAKNAKI